MHLLISVLLWTSAAFAIAPPSGEFSTDFTKRIVDFAEIRSGGPSKDGIPAVDEPLLVSTAVANRWLKAREPVVRVRVGQSARAYPIQILMWHEIVNDSVGGRELSVTYCPLCNTAIVFDRAHEGRVLDFGTTGRLRGTALAYSRKIAGRTLDFQWKDDRITDVQTSTTWSTDGVGLSGPLRGEQLTPVVGANHFWFSWAAFKPKTRLWAPASQPTSDQ